MSKQHWLLQRQRSKQRVQVLDVLQQLVTATRTHAKTADVYVAMVYGPIAAFLIELVQTRISYTFMSLGYHRA